MKSRSNPERFEGMPPAVFQEFEGDDVKIDFKPSDITPADDKPIDVYEQYGVSRDTHTALGSGKGLVFVEKNPPILGC